MRWKSFLQMGAAALALSLCARAIELQSQSWQRELLTQDLCSLVANYLETSSVRSAYEGMQQGIARSPFPKACISILDKGNHISPDCVEPNVRYQLTVCKVEGNRGIRAEISYPTEPVITQIVTELWFSLWAIGWMGLVFLGEVATYFARRITEELGSRLFSKSPDTKKDGPTARLAHWLALRSGVLKRVREQTAAFEGRIKDYEAKARVESALRAKNEVEAIKAKERFEEIKKIRHDLKSPLSSLLAVQEQFTGDEQSRQALSTGIQKIYVMLDNLGYEKPDPNAVHLTIVETVAEEAVALLTTKFEISKQVRITLKYNPLELSAVAATADGLMRVLNNFLENSFDASALGGEIQLSITTQDSECKITIIDNGCGISPEIRPRLFEKGATFGKVNGTGYGLYQCKETVESWNGVIEFESRPGRTRFVISLPKLQTGASFVGLPSRKRLWVIDDDAAVAESLDESGYEVVATALTYQEGVALLKKPIPETVAVLVDFRLDGGKYGTDLIAGHPSGRQMYLCTNDYDSPEVVRKAHHLGVRILPKPLCFLADVRVEELV